MAANFLLKGILTVASIGLNMMKRIEGPRVSDPKVTGGDYNAPWYRVWGTRWISPPVIWAKDLKEVKRRRKTKGGKYNEYTYFGSWLHGLACHELAAVRRIKFDGHLVYDVSGEGPVSLFDVGGGSIADYMLFQPGTFTQDVDPVVAADVEAKHGAGAALAYRGRSTLRFHDVPLEKFGNRIPQVEVEVVAVASPNYPWETFATVAPQPNRMWGATFSTDFSRFMWSDGTTYEIWDVAARSRMISGTLPVATTQVNRFGMYADGHFLAVADNFADLVTYSADGLSATTVTDAFPAILFDQRLQQEVWVLPDQNGTERYCTIPAVSLRYFYTDAIAGAAISDGVTDPALTADLTMEKLTGADWAPCAWFNDLDGRIWAVGRKPATGETTAYFKCISGGSGFLTVTGLSSAGIGAFGDCAACVAPNGQFVLAWAFGASGHLHAIDPVSGSITASLAITMDVYNTEKQFANFRFGASTIWLDNGSGTAASEVDLNTLTVLRTLDLTDWKAETADGILYDPVNHALICAPTGDQVITWRYLDRLGNPGVTLGDIVADTHALCGSNPAEIDVSLLTQPIAGYSTTGATGRDWIEPLLSFYDVDARPHGFGVQYLPRGGAAGATLASTGFVRQDGDEPLFETDPEDSASSLPKLVTLQFADTAIEQQPGAAMSPPLFEQGSEKVLTLDMSNLALDADSARQLVARYARRLRADARPVTLALPGSALALEPGDVHPLDLAGVGVTARLETQVLEADGRIRTEWKRDDPSFAVLDGATGAVADGRSPAVVTIPGLSKGFVLDIPLLSDADASAAPQVTLAAAPYSAGAWSGAGIFREVGGEYSDEFAAVASGDQAVWGTTTDALAAPGSPWLWDRLNTVNVRLQVGTLAGCTEADVDADPARNLCWLAGELLNFTVATLEGDGTWTLGGFKRGRRGTERACGGHAAGEVFLLLDRAQPEALALSDVGTTQSFKAITAGRTEAGAFPIALAPFTGASLKPYAPCHLAAAQDGSDWDLAWVRRTRIGGAWTSGTPIPLGEAAEEYELEIMDGATVKRTVTGLTSAAYTYASADQTTDFGAPLTSAPAFRVYQMSDTVGRGFVAEFP